MKRKAKIVMRKLTLDEATSPPPPGVPRLFVELDPIAAAIMSDKEIAESFVKYLKATCPKGPVEVAIFFPPGFLRPRPPKKRKSTRIR
jgi:hypothetical protein